MRGPVSPVLADRIRVRALMLVESIERTLTVSVFLIALLPIALVLISVLLTPNIMTFMPALTIPVAMIAIKLLRRDVVKINRVLSLDHLKRTLSESDVYDLLALSSNANISASYALLTSTRDVKMRHDIINILQEAAPKRGDLLIDMLRRDLLGELERARRALIPDVYLLLHLIKDYLHKDVGKQMYSLVISAVISAILTPLLLRYIKLMNIAVPLHGIYVVILTTCITNVLFMHYVGKTLNISTSKIAVFIVVLCLILGVVITLL